MVRPREIIYTVSGQKVKSAQERILSVDDGRRGLSAPRTTQLGGGLGGFAPDLRATPGSGGCEVYADGNAGEDAGSTTAGDFLASFRGRHRIHDLPKELCEALAQLRNGVADVKQVGTDDCSGEVEAVAGVVEMAFKSCRLFPAKRKRHGKEVEAVGRHVLRGCVACACASGALGRYGRRRAGTEENIA